MVGLTHAKKLYDLRNGTVNILVSNEKYREIEEYDDDSDDYELDAYI